jgi:hypothetical protein
VSQHVLLIGLITFGSLFFELMIFPVLVWPCATRIPVLVTGFLFHTVIGLTIRIIMFTEVMPVFYLCFLEKEHYDWVADRVRALIRKKNSTRRAINHGGAPAAQ